MSLRQIRERIAQSSCFVVCGPQFRFKTSCRGSKDSQSGAQVQSAAAAFVARCGEHHGPDGQARRSACGQLSIGPKIRNSALVARLFRRLPPGTRVSGKLAHGFTHRPQDNSRCGLLSCLRALNVSSCCKIDTPGWESTGPGPRDGDDRHLAEDWTEPRVRIGAETQMPHTKL